MVISSENVQIIKDYVENVKNTTKTIRSVNDLNMAIKDFEHSAFEIEKENRSLKYQLELKDDEIDSLKGELSAKDKIIGKLQAEKERLKQEIHKFKDFWHSIMGHFHKRICYDKDVIHMMYTKNLCGGFNYGKAAVCMSEMRMSELCQRSIPGNRWKFREDIRCAE